AIVGVGLAVVMCVRIMNANRIQQCKNNLMRMGEAIKEYESVHDCLPPMLENKQVPAGSGTYAQVSFFYQLLPYIEQESLLNKGYLNVGCNRIPLYECPVDLGPGMTAASQAYSSYATNFAIYRGRVDPNTTPATNIRFNTSQACPASSSTIVIG